jgi:hypothetical protein
LAVLAVLEHADRLPSPIDAMVGDETVGDLHDLDDVHLLAVRALARVLGLDPEPLSRSRRVLARSCLDWTQRRPHLAGAIPAAITAQMIERGWLPPAVADTI